MLGFERVLVLALQCVEPESILDAANRSDVLLKALSKCVSWEGMLHIQDHPETGHRCAEGLVDVTLQVFREYYQADHNTLLEGLGLPVAPSDPNKEIRDEILKEIDT